MVGLWAKTGAATALDKFEVEEELDSDDDEQTRGKQQ
jgi:hypothetical protein